MPHYAIFLLYFDMDRNIYIILHNEEDINVLQIG